MTKITGYCRLCGEMKVLSEEHIPPRSAFNDKGIIYESMKDALGMTGRPYTKARNGITADTLCKECNSLTGGLYGTAFVKWSQAGYEWLDKLALHDVFYLPFYIKPLNVIKQAIVMSLAVLDEHRIAHYEYLRRFILNREHRYLPPDMRVYIYFTKATKPRFSNLEMGIFRIDVGAIEYVNAEIALPPFGYCITSTSQRGEKSLAEHQQLIDISWFSKFGYNEWTEIALKLPIKEVNSPFPLDYRTKVEVEANLKAK